MSSSTNSFKRVTIGLLCLLLLISFMFLGTEEISAGAYLVEVDIISNRPFCQGADIKAFLDSVWLNEPDMKYVKDFTFYLWIVKSNGDLIPVKSGKVDPKLRYMFEVEIELKPGNYFHSNDYLYVAFNNVEIDHMGAIYAGSPSMTGWWWLKPLPVYKVTFNTDGGKPVPPVQWVVEGDRVEYPEEPAKKGYEFLGWWHDVPRFSEQWDFRQELYQDLPLIAEWKPLPTTTTTTKRTTTTTTTTKKSTTTTTTTKKPTTTTTTTTTTTLLETEPTTLLTEEPSTTTPESLEPTTTTETVVLTTIPDESDETTLPSGEAGEKKGFDFRIILYSLGGAALLFLFGITVFILGRKSK